MAASAGNDIIARLRLNGQQFVSDTKGAFSAFNQQAVASAQQAKSAFQTNFDQIQALARTALQMPATATGSLNLDVAGARNSAAQAQNQAVALREVADAAERAAISVGDTSEATRLYVTAAKAAALEAEDTARGLGQEAVALERIQAELNKSATGVTKLSAANDRAVRSSAQHRMAVQDLGYQISDFGTQVLSGQGVMRAMVQQSGQVAFALSGMEGAAGSVGKFMAGPWGAAILIGVEALSMLAPKILESSSELEKLAKNADAAVTAADAFGTAESNLSKVIDLTTGKLKTHNLVLLETVKLQNQIALQQANADIKKSVDEQRLRGLPGAAFRAPTGGSIGQGANGGIGGIGSIDASIRAGRIQDDQQKQIDAAMARLTAVVGDDAFARRDPSQYGQAIGKQAQAAIDLVNKLGGAEGKAASKNVADLNLQIAKIASSGEQKAAALEAAGVLAGGPVPDDLKPYSKDKKRRQKKAPDTDGLVNRVTNDIASYAGQFTDAPTFIEKADAALRKLDQDAAALEKKKAFIDPAKFTELQAAIVQTKAVIQANLAKPYDDFIRSQDRSLRIQQLQLAGRDVEAAAVQNTLRLTDQMGPLNERQLANVLQRAEAEDRISKAIAAQKREWDIYLQSFSALQQTFDQFLTDLSVKPRAAFKDLIPSLVGDFQSLQRKLLSNQLFGGLDEQLADYVKGQTGPKSAVDYLTQQAHAAGDGLADLVQRLGQISGGMGMAANDNASALGLSAAPVKLNISNPADLLDALRADRPEMFGSDDSSTTSEIVVTGRKLASALDGNGKAQLSAAGFYNKAGSLLGDRIEKLTGVTLPKALKDNLGTLMQGASIGGMAGGAFASITGGRQSALGSQIGGALGNYAGKELGKALGDSLGSLGKLAGPLGSIAGGILGSVVGGLFKKIPKGGSTIGGDGFGGLQITSTFGNDSKAEAASKADANGVIQSINQIAKTLGASITGGNITIGSYKGNYRVNTQGTVLGGSSSPVPGLHDFGEDEQAAVQFAIQQYIQKGVVAGISQAAINILKSGQDLQTALDKALMIESIPKDLKAMLDPVGAAIDALNEKWSDTVSALKEGGATAEQMAQAQQLYNLQLDQVKATTASASQGLKDFLQSLKVGSNSPLSLRDQESAAKAELQPFLDSIAAGKTIDQDKYQQAAQQFLDVERQLYASTDAYFQQFNAIQEWTNKAIAAIDNVTPIASPANASDPFASATAAATQKTASATEASADMLAQQTQLLSDVRGLLSQIAANGGAGGSSFASGGIARGFVGQVSRA